MTIFLVPLSTIFEVTFIREKWIINLFTGLLLLTYFYFQKRKADRSPRLLFLPVLAISAISFSTAIFYLYSFQLGQFKKSLLWGRDEEMHKTVEFLTPTEKVLYNGNHYLLSFYRKDLSQDVEAQWKLGNNIPKNNLLKIYNEKFTEPYPYKFSCEDIITYAKDNNFTKILFLKSLYSTYKFSREECWRSFVSNLKLENKIELKGKDLLIFSVL